MSDQESDVLCKKLFYITLICSIAWTVAIVGFVY